MKNKIKNIIFFLLALTFSNLAWATVEYGTLDVAGGNTSLVLNQGDIFEITNFEDKFALSVGTYNLINFTAPDGTVRNVDYRLTRTNPGGTTGSYAPLNSGNIVINGPTTITLGDVGWIMYKLTRAPNPQPAAASTEGN